jgi:hypothetical protein
LIKFASAFCLLLGGILIAWNLKTLWQILEDCNPGFPGFINFTIWTYLQTKNK